MTLITESDIVPGKLDLPSFEIDAEIDNLKSSQIIGGGRDGIVFSITNGKVVKIFFDTIQESYLREYIKYLLSTSGKLSKLSKLSLNREVSGKLEPHLIALHHEILRKYIQNQGLDPEIQVVPLVGLATYCGKVRGIIMENVEGVPSSISSHPELIDLCSSAERDIGICLDKFGRNVILTDKSKVLVDIL